MSTRQSTDSTRHGVIPAADSTRHGVIPAAMRAALTRRYGTSEVVSVEDVAVPEAANGELLVKVEASSLNALDWHFLTGTPYVLRVTSGVRRPKRVIPGADVAGTVVAVGSGADRFEVGDRVFGECGGGGCADYVAVDEDHVVTVPAAVGFEAAGATPVAGLTALQGLRTHAAVGEGDRVLINGAAGGVGTFAVQIAKALGADVTAVCSSRNTAMVESLGADTVLDYTSEDFVALGDCFDVLFDNVGNRTPAECLSVLSPAARYVAITGPKTNRWLGPIPHIVRTGLAFRKADASFHQFTASPNPEDLSFLGELLASGRITPAVQRTIGLDGVKAGLAEIGTGHARSKIVVAPAV